MALSVVLVTLQGGGHFNTGMLFAKKLASQGCSVTVLLPWFDPSGLNTDVNPNIELRVLLESAINPSKSLEYTFLGVRRSSPNLKLVTSSTFSPAPLLQNSLREFLDLLRPKAVVLDRMVMFWASLPVEERGIPKYILYTGASAHLAVMLSFHGPSQTKDLDDTQSVVHVPGLPPLRSVELPLDVVSRSNTFYLGKEGVAKHFLNSSGILLNTSKELEGPILDALDCCYPEIRFIPIGPLYPASYLEDHPPSKEDYRRTSLSKSIAGKSDEDGIISWLDEQPAASVVYICFGSFIRLCDEMNQELARGLESSGFRFLWSLPNPKSEDPADYLNRVLPTNFVDSTSGKGRIVTGWVPQQMIFSHPAIGACVSHCGWSSVIECILLAGVPILAWPFMGDQPPTCRHLVDEYKIAVDIGVDGVPSAGDVERALHAVMEDEELRERAKERRKLVRMDARSTEPGSSAHNFAEFVSSLK